LEGISSSLSSVESYLKLAEARSLIGPTAYHEANNIASATEGEEVYTITTFSPDQQNYLKKYLAGLDINNTGSLYILLDKGIVTNIGYKDGHDIGIGIP
jgi:hypothetical protein